MLKKIIKSVLPGDTRRILRNLEKHIRYAFRRVMIKLPVAAGVPMKIIVGAALTYQRGWYSTNEQWFDITRAENWVRVFKGKAPLTNVLAEHVFEHLTEEETRRSLKLISAHMMPGARIRIAVPDGYNPDPVYIKHVGIAGIGPDAEDHKQLLNSNTLTGFLEEAGFIVGVLEGYIKSGELVQKPIDSAEGRVLRSRDNKKNMTDKVGWEFAEANTSLIVDGIKPK